MEIPLILVNFKCYKKGTGRNALKIAKACEMVSKKYGVEIAVAPQYTDIKTISEKTKVKVFAQHIDAVEEGAYTGHITAMAIREAGAIGTIINHSEKKIDLSRIEKCLEIARKYDLVSVVCSESLEKAKKIARLSPDFIAFEDPLLIGSGRAISKVKAYSVKKFVDEIRRINPRIKVLCGAGISSGSDVKAALKLGTKGILVASAVVNSEKPTNVLEDFAKAIQE
ncbi:MAG: triose-phosphate isomerase [Candidatus Aenigmatarchaeota archaeon]